MVSAYSEERFLTEGKPDAARIHPFILTMPDNRFWALGDVVGHAWKDGATFGGRREEPGRGAPMDRDIQSFMKLAVAALLVFLLLAAASCARRDTELVYRAYEYASIYPEAFDEYAIQHLFARQEEFEACAAKAGAALAESFGRVTEHCKNLEAEYQTTCYDVDETKVGIILDAMVSTVRQQTLYSQTPPGQAAAMGKQLLGAGNWEKIQRQLVPIFRPLLVCN